MTKYLTIISLFLNIISVAAQSIDHWETVLHNSYQWRYNVGSSEPPSDWMQPSFNDSQWPVGAGGFGYGDNDDNTQITNTISVYMRNEFEIVDMGAIGFAVLHADFDDAFVAYLNGVEIARSNIGQPGVPPSYDETAAGLHEAVLYSGGVPELYSLYGQALENILVEGSNTLSIQVHNQNISSSDLSSNFFFSVGITDMSINYTETPTWFSPPLFTSNLPLIIINTTETTEIYDEPRVPADMGIIDNGPGQTNSIFDNYNEYDGRIEIEIRGASSQGFPKKNYGFETQFENGNNNNVPLLGMPAENDWVLHGPYADKSLLRNVLAYYMGEATGHYTPRTRLCELIINGDYRGIYVFTERIKQDANRVDIANLTINDVEGDELTGGYILQIDRDDGSVDDGWYSNYPDWKFYAFDDPDYDVILPVQREYIIDYINNFENSMDDSNYASTYSNYIDVDSWIDYFLVNEVGKHIDAFKLSFFLHKKKDSNGGKLHFGPLWDFNLAFGNFNFDCSPDPDGWAYEFGGSCHDGHPFWLRKLVEIPEVSDLAKCRWMELRAGPFHTDSLMQFIDERASLLEEAKDRNFERWPVIGAYVWPNDFIGSSYDEEITFLKYWLIQRLSWMDDNMIGECEIVSSSNVDNSAAQIINVFPNPAEDQLFIEIRNTKIKNINLYLYDVLGNLLKTQIIDKPLCEFNIHDLSDGIYIYIISRDNVQIGTGKIIKSVSGF